MRLLKSHIHSILLDVIEEQLTLRGPSHDFFVVGRDLNGVELVMILIPIFHIVKVDVVHSALRVVEIDQSRCCCLTTVDYK